MFLNPLFLLLGSCALALSRSPALSFALPGRYFHARGLPSLYDYAIAT